MTIYGVDLSPTFVDYFTLAGVFTAFFVTMYVIYRLNKLLDESETLRGVIKAIILVCLVLAGCLGAAASIFLMLFLLIAG